MAHSNLPPGNWLNDRGLLDSETRWTIREQAGGGESVEVAIGRRQAVPRRTDPSGSAFTVRTVGGTSLPEWLTALLTNNRLGATTLYSLYQERRAIPR